MSNRLEIYVRLTNQIVKNLENQIIPWEQPWFQNGSFNAVTGKRYRGINHLSLSMALVSSGMQTNDPRFLTFKQAQSNGWKVKKGEKSFSSVVFFKMMEVEDENDDGNSKKFPLLKQSAVFHASQIDGIPEYIPAGNLELEPNKLAQRIVDASGVKIVEHPDKAFFSGLDFIGMPPIQDFKSSDLYYGTLMHEMGHWTGFHTRLNRHQFSSSSSPEYAEEELIAELASVFLCAETGIHYPAGNHNAYIKYWVQKLKGDPMEIHKASKKAMEAVQYLLQLANIDDM